MSWVDVDGAARRWVHGLVILLLKILHKCVQLAGGDK